MYAVVAFLVLNWCLATDLNHAADARSELANVRVSVDRDAAGPDQDQPAKEGSDEKKQGRMKDRKITLQPSDEPGTLTPGGKTDEEFPLPTGPMRLVVSLISDTRIRQIGEPVQGTPKPAMRFQADLTGERLPNIVRIGPLVVEEAVDDTGASLAPSAEELSETREVTFPFTLNRNILARGHITRMATLASPERRATKLSKISGYVRAVYSGDSADILIDDPLQFANEEIVHPRLQELGIKIRLVVPGRLNKRSATAAVGLQYLTGEDRIKEADFCDAWMKSMFPRSRPGKTPEGEDYVHYDFVAGKLNEDCQLILSVYPEIETEDIRFSWEDIELP